MSTASGDEYLVAAEAPARIAVVEPVPVARTQWPFVLVVLLGLGGLVFVALGALERGVLGLIVAVGLAGLLRLVLPTRTAGLLVSRSRIVDVASLAVLAAGLAATLLLLK